MKVKVLEMVQVVVEMKSAQCCLYVPHQVHPHQLKVHEMVREVVEMKLNPVPCPCFLALFIFCMP